MIEAIGLRLAGYPDIPAADLRLVNGRIYGIFDAGDGAASACCRAWRGGAAAFRNGENRRLRHGERAGRRPVGGSAMPPRIRHFTGA